MGTFVEVRCQNNTVLSGESFLSCTESGTWDFSIPTCVQVTTTQAPTTTTVKSTTVKSTTVKSTTMKSTTLKTTLKTRTMTKRPTIRTTTRKPTIRTTTRKPTIRTTTRKPTIRTTTKKPTVRTTTKKPIKTTTQAALKKTTAPPLKTLPTPKQVSSTTSTTTAMPFVLRETGTDPDAAFWQNWKNLLYRGCGNTHGNHSLFCDQIENAAEYSDLSEFALPETAEYQHMDTKLFLHLTNARRALQTPAIRANLNIENVLQLILYGDEYLEPPSNISKTMENSIRIVLCLYIDTILLDTNFKPDLTMRSSEDITQKLRNSLWQVASFAYQNYQTHQVTESIQVTTFDSSNSLRNHRSTEVAVKVVEFSNMESHTMKRVNDPDYEKTSTVPSVTITTTKKMERQTTTTDNPEAVARTLEPKTCEIQTLPDPPENSSLTGIVSKQLTTTDGLTNVTRVSIGSKLIFNCREGFDTIGDVTTAECQGDLTWSNLSFHCRGDFNGNFNTYYKRTYVNFSIIFNCKQPSFVTNRFM